MPFGQDNNQEGDFGPPPYQSDNRPMPQGQMTEQYPIQGPQGGNPPQQGVPVDKVINLRQQGLSNNQIVQTLQKDGFDSAQIFDAMNQADMQGGSGGPIPNQGGMQMEQGPPPSMPPPMQQNMQPPPMPEMPPQGMPPIQGMPPPPGGSDVSKVEEIAEAIVNEKWEEMIKRVNKIMEWKEQSENRLSKIEQQFADLKDNFDKLHRAIVGKIGEYDKNILGVGTEIKAMEKVFQKILPTFTENVSELSRITRKISTGSAQSKTIASRQRPQQK